MSEHDPTTPETGERAPEPSPRIYVASLSDYNAGRLHGEWIDANQEPDAIHAEITRMLNASTEPVAEEFAIHDHDGFGSHVNVDEYDSIERVSLLAGGIAEHGDAFGAWWSVSEPALSFREELDAAFEDQYRGEWESVATYAEQLLDDMGATEALRSIPDWLQGHITLDVEGFARDLELSGDIRTADAGFGRVFVFDRDWA